MKMTREAKDRIRERLSTIPLEKNFAYIDGYMDATEPKAKNGFERPTYNDDHAMQPDYNEGFRDGLETRMVELIDRIGGDDNES